MGQIDGQNFDVRVVCVNAKPAAVIFRLSPHPIGLSELDSGRFTDVNDAFVASLGWGRGELLARSSLELDIWVNPAQRAAIWADLLAGGQVRDREVQFRLTLTQGDGGCTFYTSDLTPEYVRLNADYTT